MLTEALATNVISRREVPPHVARQLRRVVGVRFAEVWGPVEQSATEERAYARYRGLLNDATLNGANVVNGRAVFQRTCGSCHKMYGEGGTIGPDITGSNRANLDYLLSNVLTPNAEVQDAYKMVVVTTRDGRTHSGNVVSETDRQLTLRVVGRDPVRHHQGRHPVARHDDVVDDASGPVRRAHRSRGCRSGGVSSYRGAGEDPLRLQSGRLTTRKTTLSR